MNIVFFLVLNNVEWAFPFKQPTAFHLSHSLEPYYAVWYLECILLDKNLDMHIGARRVINIIWIMGNTLQ